MARPETITVDEFRRLGSKRKEQPETPIRKAITDYLRMNGWMVTRIVQSALSEPGIPDLVAIRGGHHVWIEVKAPKGRLSGHQERWLQDLEDHGGHYIVARGIDDVEHLCRR